MLTLEISCFGIATMKYNGKVVGRWTANETTREWFEKNKSTLTAEFLSN